MNRNKKIFLIAALIFIIFIIIISYDISRRTTFPGSKPQLKERIKRTIDGQKEDNAIDSILRDSL